MSTIPSDFVTIEIKAIKNRAQIPHLSYSYQSKFVPRVGEKICHQYWEMEIFDIHWNDDIVFIYADCSHFA